MCISFIEKNVFNLTGRFASNSTTPCCKGISEDHVLLGWWAILSTTMMLTLLHWCCGKATPLEFLPNSLSGKNSLPNNMANQKNSLSANCGPMVRKRPLTGGLEDGTYCALKQMSYCAPTRCTDKIRSQRVNIIRFP